MAGSASGSQGNGRSIPIWVGVVGLLITAATIVFAAGSDKADLKQHGLDITDHELRIRAVERVVSQIEIDVTWIREYLEGQTRGKQAKR